MLQSSNKKLNLKFRVSDFFFTFTGLRMITFVLEILQLSELNGYFMVIFDKNGFFASRKTLADRICPKEINFRKRKSLFLVDSAAFWKNFSQVDSIAFHKLATGQSQGIARRIDSKQWRESFEWIFRIKQCMIKTIITRKLSFWCMRQNHYSGKATNRDPPS